jgi:hypothetical protein
VLPILLTNDTIHGTISLIINAEDVSIALVIIIAIITLEPEIATIRLISPILYIRNLTAVYRNTHLRNRTLKKLNLGHETLVNLALEHATPVTLRNVLIAYTFSI